MYFNINNMYYSEKNIENIYHVPEMLLLEKPFKRILYLLAQNNINYKRKLSYYQNGV